MDRDELAHAKIRKLYPAGMRRELKSVLEDSLFAKALALVFPLTRVGASAEAANAVVALAPACELVDKFFEERSVIDTEALMSEWECEASWKVITHPQHPIAEAVLVIAGGPPAIEMKLLFHVPRVFAELSAAQRLQLWVMHERELADLQGPGAKIDLVYDRGVPVREASMPSAAIAQALAHCAG